MPTPTALALFISILIPLAASADDGPPPAPVPALASEPVFSALLVDGTTAAGRLRQLGPDGRVVLADKSDRSIPLRELVKLTREGPPPPFPPEGPMALFPEGDRLRAVINQAGEAALEVRSYVLGEITIPLDSLLGLVLTPPAAADEVEAALERVREQPRHAEVLWLANGDRLSGGFLGLGQRTVSFQPDAGPIEVDRAQVVALGFDPALVAYPRPKGDFLELTLADGSRLGVAGAKIEQGQVVATTRFGATIRLSPGELAGVHVRSEAIDYLADRPADAAEYVGYVGPTRPYRRNAAVDGRPIRLGGRPYDRGLGTQSRTLLAYRLRPGDKRFQALVGLDDRAGPLGSVAFRVRVDGKDRFVSPPLSARDTPKAIDVDVEGAKLLILITEFAERGEVRDFADWAEARLIR